MSGFGPPGGGGGFGPPGAGGFGAPPGGGGFGPPPGGGGFNAPPPGSGGGGFAPPPGGGGPAPSGGLAHIPFSSADLTNLRHLALLMMASGALLVVSAGLSILGAIVVAVMGRDGGNAFGGAVQLGITGLLAVFLVLGGRAFKKVADTDEADQKYLAEGLTNLRNYFMLKGVVFAFAIVLFCLCCGGMMLMGGMAGALMHR